MFVDTRSAKCERTGSMIMCRVPVSLTPCDACSAFHVPSCLLQTVFFDMRRAVLEEMYQHHVESARMHPVLVQLDAALGDMCAAGNDSLHAYLARSLLQATTVAMQRVLLDGGPYRYGLLLLLL